ncbi:MAG: Txe/YoeB family addiction module toxin [Clostridiaceae bacterium]|nr:Txe/YoeB family addiction module toxin [Clostridiaceae bacterium]
MGYRIVFTKRAEKDIKKLEQTGLDKKAKELLRIIRDNPYKNPPPYEKLVGDLKGQFSRRINITHRLVYQVLDEEKTIKVLSMWTHYE